MLKKMIGKFIRRHPGNSVVQVGARISRGYLRYYFNESYWDFHENGEFRCMDIFGKHAPEAPIVFDVGANYGQWSLMVGDVIPTARIFCFELIPDIFCDLEERCRDSSRIRVFNYGLSSYSGEATAKTSSSHPGAGGINPHLLQPKLDVSSFKEVAVTVRTGDSVVSELGLDRIDFLKIDTEGHEVDVLSGFRQTLQGDAAPTLIQFEYGHTYMSNRKLLKDVYDLLAPNGYRIGRVHPNLVEFTDYSLEIEHFRMGNYVAVRGDDRLLAALANTNP